jgi:predicted nuclease of predicted toxin-antitoxin system
MRFLIDAQLPPALARWIESQGYAAAHVFECLGADASDRAIWEYAAEAGIVIVSKDEDFFTFRTLHPDGPALIWIRVGNTRWNVLLEWFSRLFPYVVEALQRGEKLIEIGL